MLNMVMQMCCFRRRDSNCCYMVNHEIFQLQKCIHEDKNENIYCWMKFLGAIVHPLEACDSSLIGIKGFLAAHLSLKSHIHYDCPIFLLCFQVLLLLGPSISPIIFTTTTLFCHSLRIFNTTTHFHYNYSSFHSLHISPTTSTLLSFTTHFQYTVHLLVHYTFSLQLLLFCHSLHILTTVHLLVHYAFSLQFI